MAKKLVIVESPSKAKTIKKFLGRTYKVIASNGHLRDLPKSSLGVDLENDFEPKYITIRGKGKILAKIKREVKKADKVYLATDPDREGEAISWHLKNVLDKFSDDIERITFNEITKKAVKNSIKDARGIDMGLVDAQQARRILDRLVGYKISPLLWKKIRRGLSAGRVQSVTLKLIVEKEREIENFVPKEYWTLKLKLTNGKEEFESDFYGKNGKKLKIKNEKQLNKILEEMKKEDIIVDMIKKGSRIRKPKAPFKTSTLQRAAFSNLGFSTKKTMVLAQKLYEGKKLGKKSAEGLITYMRTDSLRISDEARKKAEDYIKEEIGEKYLAKRKKAKNKKNAQDAHEAIRPTQIDKSPKDIKKYLGKDEYRLYKLIWERFIASQMKNAKFETNLIKIKIGNYEFRTTGSILKFEGFIKVYSYVNIKDQEVPKLKENEKLTKKEEEKEQHFTKPPARYTEASLVKELEKNGVGRPSTYSSIIGTLIGRRYVLKEEKRLVPTEIGEIVNDLLVEYFEKILQVDFTANIENLLDKVENNEKDWKEILREFYPTFKEALKTAEEEIEEIEIEDEVTDIDCEKCGEKMVIKHGRYGKFLACSGFPECKNTKSIYEEIEAPCPKCGDKVYIKRSRKGRKYYGCENNPKCDFMSWNKPIDEKCPDCGHVLVEKGRKNVKIVCGAKDCNFKKTDKKENKK